MQVVLAILEPLLEAHKRPKSTQVALGSTSWEEAVGPPPDTTAQPMSEWSLISTDSEEYGAQNNSSSRANSGSMVPR